MNNKIGSRPENLKNKKFGLLTVLEIAHKKNKRIFWNCLCDCGNKLSVRSYCLKNGNTKSCGCLHKKILSEKINLNHSQWKGFGEISAQKFGGIKNGASNRNTKIQFNVTIEYIWNLFIQQNRKCALSGFELNFNSKNRATDGTASLDRIDSSKGYEIGNVQWIHKNLQSMKWNKNEQEFIEWCGKVWNYVGEKSC